MKDGILIINKPQWYTSFDVVAKCRIILGSSKIGHTGTLDPMATGVLVVCVGKATPLVNELTSDDKIYKTTIKLGIKTDTGDMSGIIEGIDFKDELRPAQKMHLSDISKQQFEINIEYTKAHPQSFNFSKTQIEEILYSFIGKQTQTPSIYSSIKVDGKKLYEYAREGKEVEIPSREIEVYDIKDIEWNEKDEITYVVNCSKGTYIRTLNEDIAKRLGTTGTTMMLQRVKTGRFSLSEAVDLENISEEKIISIEKLFDNKIELNEKDEKKFLNGISLDVNAENGMHNIYIDKKYYGLGKVLNGHLKRFIIL